MKTEIKETKAAAHDPTAFAGLENRLASVTSIINETRQQFDTLESRFQQEMDGIKSVVSQQQRDVEDLRSKVRSRVPAADYAQDMATLRSEITHLRRQLEETRAQGAERVEAAFPFRELEVLTHNIAKISGRASQVETLRMELEILKGRVERAETSRQAADSRQLPRASDPAPPVYSDIFPVVRKRAASPALGPDPKRPASSLSSSDFPSYSDLPETRYTTPLAWPARRSPAQGRADTQVQGHDAPRRGHPASSSTGTSARPRKR
jgi:hypothetical protein